MKLNYCLFVAVLLSGCGGGAGAPAETAPAPSVPPISSTPPPEDTPGDLPEPVEPADVEMPPVEVPPVEQPPVEPPPAPVPPPPIEPAPIGPALSNQPPVAVNDYVVLDQNSTLNRISVLSNDFDNKRLPLRLTDASALAGDAFVDGGNVLYSAAVGFIGRDIVDYGIRNSAGLKDRAQVEVLVVSEDGRTVELTWEGLTADSGYVGVIISQRNVRYPYLETIIEPDKPVQQSLFLTVAEAGQFEFKVAFVDASGASSAWSETVTADIYD